MGDNDENKGLKQKLNFSCEEEHENGGQKQAQEGEEAQSKTPERPRGQDPEAKLTPPRTPFSNKRDLSAFHARDQASPGQGLGTPASHSLACPETPPAPPDKSRPSHCESPFTPKVSPLWGERKPAHLDLCSFSSADREWGCSLGVSRMYFLLCICL